MSLQPLATTKSLATVGEDKPDIIFFEVYELNKRICLADSCYNHFSSVQFGCSVVSDCLQPPESQHARPPCPSPTCGAHSNSCPSSQWHHPTILSSVIPFSSCLQSFPASASFPLSLFFASDGQRIGNFSFIFSPSYEYSELIFFRIDWLDIFAVQGTLRSLLQNHSLKALILWHSAT